MAAGELGATSFTIMFTAAGGSELLRNVLLGLEVNPIIIIIAMQITFFILGMFMDPAGIILITTPIYVPVIRELGFSAVWFGVVLIVNMEMAYLTPPYGFNLFYMRGIAPKEVTMVDIYRSIIPFVMIQAIALILVILFPNIILWLPNLIFGPEM